ncbi:MAG: 2-hydroxychromene-2-carboxylate isomerase [Rhizobiaceae bacterium]
MIILSVDLVSELAGQRSYDIVLVCWTVQESETMVLEIWFEFASTYSYLTVLRAEAVLHSQNVPFEWKPFLLGPIFRDKGMNTSPFVLDPQKGAYMWRDLERRAAHYGLPYAKPPIFPMNPILAARIMISALDEAWCGDFAKAVFRAQFVHGLNIADSDVLADALRSCGADPDRFLDLARDDSVKAALRTQTYEAQNLNIFGAPTFKVGQELFWGDDRLEDAIAWFKKEAPASGLP